MIRLLLVLVAVFFAVAAVKRISRPEQRRREDTPEKLVRCARCGVYVTEKSSVREGDRLYCSEKHRRESLQEG